MVSNRAKLFLIRSVPFVMAACLCVIYFSPLFMKDLGAKIVLGPARYPKGYYDKPSIDGIKAKEYFIPNGHGVNLHAWLFEKKGAQFTVIFHHGRGENLTYSKSWAKRFLDCGTSVVLYDYSGFGKSGGNISFDSLTSDGEAVYNYCVTQLRIKPQNLVNSGFSMGCAVASYVSSRNECGGVLLFAPYDSMTALVKRKFLFWRFSPDWMFNYFEKFNVIENLRKTKALTLVLYAPNDQMMGVECTKNFFTLDKRVVACIPVSKVGHGDFLDTNLIPYIKHLFETLSHNKFDTAKHIEDSNIQNYIQACFDHYKKNYPVKIRKIKSVEIFVVPGSNCHSGILNEKENTFYILITEVPKTKPSSTFWGAIGHECFHIATPPLKDSYMEGLCQLFSEDMLKEKKLDWKSWSKEIQDYEPYFWETYCLVRDLRNELGTELLNKLFLHLKPIGSIRDSYFDIDAWINELPSEKRERARSIIMQRYEKIDKLEKPGQLLQFAKPSI
ncbi:MAG: alpha/beta hydrolase [Candidatus Melainabacteria bacterium]|nr:MAG: alpha/beta hydrolase [Candidatus Melainabacteria bacterium]